MMNYVYRSILSGVSLIVVLAGCQKSEVPAATSNREPPQAVTNAVPIPQMPTRDPSLPDAATAFAAQDAADRAKGMPDPTALQQKAAPQEKMTKEEESKAMPLPGQANDHSTPALAKKVK